MGSRRIRALPAWLAMPAALAAFGAAPAQGASRDTAYYPVSAHAPSETAAPPLVFVKLFEVTVEGTPAADPLVGPAHEGDAIVVHTSRGAFLIDPRTGALRDGRQTENPSEVFPQPAPHEGSAPASESSPGERALEPAAPAGAAPDILAPATVPVSVSCEIRGGTPRWVRHLHLGVSGVACLEGPGGVVAIVGRDGTLFGRDRRRGHLFWRRTAAHRISRPPVSHGAYLFVAPDASRDLQALRWADGSLAGVFRLDSDDAYFVSAPVLSGDTVYVLAVESPRPQTRLIALSPTPQTVPSGSVPAPGIAP